MVFKIVQSPSPSTSPDSVAFLRLLPSHLNCREIPPLSDPHSCCAGDSATSSCRNYQTGRAAPRPVHSDASIIPASRHVRAPRCRNITSCSCLVMQLPRAPKYKHRASKRDELLTFKQRHSNQEAGKCYRAPLIFLGDFFGFFFGSSAVAPFLIVAVKKAFTKVYSSGMRRLLARHGMSQSPETSRKR